MTLFKRDPASLTELCNHAGSLGGAFGQVQTGTMPPEFQAAEEVGSDKTLKRAQQSARMRVTGHG